MGYSTLNEIISELQHNAKAVDGGETDVLTAEILKADRVFTAGAGRSGFAARAFANRLMHLGFDVAFVGEPTTPPIKKGDLLVICSGSGSTPGLVSMAKEAKRQKAGLATVTIAPNNAIGTMADTVISLPGTTRKLSGADRTEGSIQPSGSMFEQLAWLVFDSIVMDLMKATDQTPEDLIRRHGNLE